jgi:Tfp pilus assembly protein PilO
MKKNEQKLIGGQELAIVISVIVVMLLGAIFFVIVPQTKRAFEDKKQLELKKNEFDQLGEDASRANNFSLLSDDLRGREYLLSKAIINEDQVIDLINKIEEVAKQSDEKIEFSYQEEVAKKKSEKDKDSSKDDKVKLKISTEGEYENFLSFLYKLENLEYVFEIKSMKASQCKKSFSTSGLLTSNGEERECFSKGELVISVFID